MLSTCAYAQSFEKVIRTHHLDYGGFVYSKGNSHYVLNIRNNSSVQGWHSSELFKLDNSGSLIDSLELVKGDTIWGHFRMIERIGEKVLILGDRVHKSNNKGYAQSLFELDLDAFTVAEKKKLNLIGTKDYFYEIRKNNKGNYLMWGVERSSNPNKRKLIFRELDSGFNLIKESRTNNIGIKVSENSSLIEYSNYYLIYSFPHNFLLFNKANLNFLEDRTDVWKQYQSTGRILSLNDSSHYIMSSVFPSQQKTDNFLLKMDSVKQFTLMKHFVTADTNENLIGKSTIILTKDGNLVTAYDAQKEAEFKIKDKFDSWIGVQKMDLDGEIIWRKYFGGNINYNVISMVATDDGGLLLSSYIFSPPYTKIEDYDLYILKLDANGNLVTGLNELELVENKHFTVFPNPSTNSITLKGNYDVPAIFKLYDLKGSLIARKEIYSTSQFIDLSSVASGGYIYNIQSKKRVGTGKLVLTK